jgi:hypothetical protein
VIVRVCVHVVCAYHPSIPHACGGSVKLSCTTHCADVDTIYTRWQLNFVVCRGNAKTLTPAPTPQVPEYYKSALNTQEQFNAFRAGRYQVGVETRLQQLAVSDMPFRPYSDDESARAR